MRTWLRWSAGICLLASLALGCGHLAGTSSARHPVPQALSWPAYDRDVVPVRAATILMPGVMIYSLPSEGQLDPSRIEIWSGGAVTQRDAFWERVLRDRCAMKETLQIANGGKPEPDEICRPQPSK